MTAPQVVPGLYTIPLGPVNAFLIDADGLTLVDTGYAKDTEKIAAAAQTIGRQPKDIRHILVTHCHPDHAGGLAALKQITGASAYMHSTDAVLVRSGKVPPHLKPGPGLVNSILFRIFIGYKPAEYAAAEVEHEVRDGDMLPIAGGIRVIHLPGHCAGHLAFLWEQHGGVLFVGDAASNMLGLGYSVGYENLDEAKRSLAKISALDFEIACFSHGKPLVGGAATRFKQKWATPIAR
jgi:glyoxylase-like metal-dependent hydrolase (beta-lactamase superfamily II)